MDILNEKIEGLVKKVEKSGMPYGILKKVYDRGVWLMENRTQILILRITTMGYLIRVNSFVTKSSGTWGKSR